MLPKFPVNYTSNSTETKSLSILTLSTFTTPMLKNQLQCIVWYIVTGAHYKQLEQKLKNRSDREVKALMSEHCEKPTVAISSIDSDCADGKKSPLRAPSDNDDLLLRPARDHTPIGTDSGVSWYWSENSDPSDPL